MISIRMRDVFSDEAIEEALTFLESRRDSCGADGMYLSELRTYWKMNRETVLSELVQERYHPGDVQMLETVNHKGKRRTIAAYNSVDRLLLRCMAQTLQAEFDPLFHDQSYAFREGRGVMAATNRVADLIREGFVWAARLDIRDYFGSIPLPELESLIDAELEDGKLFRLIQRYLHVNVIQDDQIHQVSKGIIQGCSLSPLWGNLYLNALDQRLDALEMSFCRYADDLVIAFREKQKASDFYSRLVRILREDFKLDVNQKKSGVLETARQQFLGYSFRVSGDGKSVTAFRAKRERYEIYRDWNQSNIRRIDRDYHIINDGILSKKDYTLLFENEDGKRYIPVETMGTLNIHSNAIFSADFFRFAAQKRLCVNIFDRYGNAVGRFTPSDNGIRGKSMLKQAKIYLDEKRRLQIARTLEISAFHNLRANLRYYAKTRRSEKLNEGIQLISGAIKELNEAADIGAMMLIEARGRQTYYAMFNEIIQNSDFLFTSRTRRPPRDPLNALISYGNTYLYHRVAAEIEKSSLDIRIGFLHSTNNRSQSLNLDIAELFKPLIVDRAIFTLVNKRMLDASEHFEDVEEGGVYLNHAGKRIFINELDAKMYQKQTQDNKPVSYETRIREEVSKLFRHIMYDEPYKPYKYY